MSKAKYHSTLSGLVDSDSDDTQFVKAMPTPDSAAESKPAGKKPRGRPKAEPKVTKTKAPTRRTSGRLTAKANGKVVGTSKSKRPALADKTNQQHASDTEEVDEFDDIAMEGTSLENSVVSVKPAKAKVTKKKENTAVRGKSAKESFKTNHEINTNVSEAVKPGSRPAKKRGPAKKEMVEEDSPEKIILESQVSPMDMDGDEDEEAEHTVPRAGHNVVHSRSYSRSNSHHRQPSVSRKRAGSASDTERSDPALRRKLGDMTKKYENLHVKYQDMREIGMKEAERNFERLKKQSEERTKISNDLIASLKADVVTQSALAKDSKAFKKQVDAQKSEIAALQAQITQIKASLSEAHAENKTLSAKLAANRTVATSVECANSTMPSSTVKATGGIRMMGTAEAVQAAQAAQLKEDLYSDLTGLLIRNVKREPDEDVFDCIQTGRNGTLHFKLAAANDKAADSYDDAQCSYIPQLDLSRDKPLMELLPDYLVDEITFPRPQAAKFYARVVKALTEKVA